jgi:hypothetical protein
MLPDTKVKSWDEPWQVRYAHAQYARMSLQYLIPINNIYKSEKSLNAIGQQHCAKHKGLKVNAQPTEGASVGVRYPYLNTSPP